MKWRNTIERWMTFPHFEEVGLYRVGVRNDKWIENMNADLRRWGLSDKLTVERRKGIVFIVILMMGRDRSEID